MDERQEPFLDASGADRDAQEIIPVQVRDQVRESIRRAAQSRDLAAEYKAIYHSEESYADPLNKPLRAAEGNSGWAGKLKLPPQHRTRPVVPLPANLSDNERLWAALAHGSTVITIAVGVATGGIATLFALLIPLGIYLAFRQRSEFVARHALQAFVAQVIGTVGLLFSWRPSWSPGW
ncbi:MAG: DUF4870 domain-containing protein [Anaerolineae bacterium]|nr:DUF4870 domain-containing protein [Anaerolineae bacterium]